MEKNLSSEEQKHYYEKRASSFDTGILFPRKNRNHILKIHEIVRLLEISDNDRILEVGTGTGIHAEYVLNQTSVEYFGVDISPQMLSESQRKLSSYENRVKLIGTDALALPFKDSVFDGVFCSGSLHHMPSPLETLNEMLRVLKPGKNIVIMEPNYYFPTNFIASKFISAEKNITLMRVKNFRKWLDELPVKSKEIHNYLYTPPIPKSLNAIYDSIDRIVSGCPFINRFSIMIYASAEKVAVLD